MQKLIVRKYTARYGFDAGCKEDIKTVVKDFFVKLMRESSVLKQGDFSAIEKSVRDLPSV